MPFEIWVARKEPWDPRDLRAYFSARAAWRIEEGFALYDHPDTGAELSAIWSPPDEVDGTPWQHGRRLMVRLNLLRPRYFALAAAEEIESLLAAFGGTVEGNQPFVRDDFLSAFEQANRGAFAAVDTDTGEWLDYDPQQLSDIFGWNQRRAWLQDLAPEVFVPRISFTLDEGRAHSTVIWTDLVPIVLPTADRVLALRMSDRDRGFVELPTERLEELLPPPARVDPLPLPYRLVGRPPDSLVGLLEELPRSTVEGLAATRVIDADLLRA